MRVVFTFDTVPRGLFGLELSDTNVYEPEERARLYRQISFRCFSCRLPERSYSFSYQNPEIRTSMNAKDLRIVLCQRHHVFQGVRGAVLALVVRQYNTSLYPMLDRFAIPMIFPSRFSSYTSILGDT